MSEENPAFAIYTEKINIIKMPKKGGIGLNDSYKNISHFISTLAHQNQLS